MGKLQDFLTGTQVLEEVDSSINGKITVVRSLAFGTYISVGGLTQSGGVLKDIWKNTLKKVKGQKSLRVRDSQESETKVKSCLILGLGGGSAAKLVGQFWPEAQITGVDLDPLMVNMGEKYLGFEKKDIKFIISDAYEYVNKNSKFKIQNYDLILIDLYIGDQYPEKFEEVDFIRLVKNNLADGGIAVFNRLYSGDKRREAMKFTGKLEKIFKKVEVVYPEANVMFICHT